MNIKKLSCAFVLILGGLFFINLPKVSAATFYFYGGVDTNWNTLGNWWSDPTFTTPALTLPTTTDDVISSGFLFSNSGPAIVIHSLTVDGNFITNVHMTVTNGATFNNDSENESGSVITGDVVFNGNSTNIGSVQGNATFNNNSGNKDLSFGFTGTVSGDASFFDTSHNGGTVSGSACFATTATDGGTVGSTTGVCSSSVPTVETLTPISSYDVYEIFRGKVTNTGGLEVTDGGFEYGTDTNYGSTINVNNSFYTDQIFTGTDPELACDTTYHYRAFATNSVGTSYGGDETFTIPSCELTSESLLYGIDGAGGNPDPAHLFLLDPVTGLKAKDIGAVGFGVTGMAFQADTGVLYGSTGGASVSPKSLITISTTTGAGTLLGTLKNGSNQSINFPDISFRSDGRLYGFNGADLYTIDITSCNGSTDTDCLVTKVGTAGLSASGNGLAFDSSDNLYLFGDSDHSYRTIDPDTGTLDSGISITNRSSNNGTIAAATFDKEDTLYLSLLNYGEPEASLATLDLTNHTLHRVENITPDMHYMDAIAFYFPPPTPEPTPEPEPEEETHHHGGSSIVRAPIIVTDASGTPVVITNDIEALQNRINELLAQIKALTEGTNPPMSTYSRNLTLGSEGDDVKALQNFLINQNLGPASVALKLAGATGYFGNLTKSALAEFQTKEGIVPASGYFGPITRAFIKNKF